MLMLFSGFVDVDLNLGVGFVLLLNPIWMLMLIQRFGFGVDDDVGFDSDLGFEFGFGFGSNFNLLLIFNVGFEFEPGFGIRFEFGFDVDNDVVFDLILMSGLYHGFDVDVVFCFCWC